MLAKNVGNIDRALRVVLGLGLLSAVVLLESGARWLGLIGIIPLATAAMGSCPLYSLFGISTCPVDPKGA